MAKKGRNTGQYRRKNLKGQNSKNVPLWVWGLGGVFLALLLVAGLLYLGYSDPATAIADIDGLVIFPAPSRAQIAPLAAMATRPAVDIFFGLK